MAVWSEIPIFELSKSNRLDGEFFQPIFLENDISLKKKKSCTLDSYLADIRYGLNVPPNYTETGLPFYRALNLKEYGIDGELLKIPYTMNQVGKMNILREGDILIVRSGANVGDSGIIFSDMIGATFGSYTIRVRVQDIDPYYLYAFLKSSFGRLQTVRLRSGAAQPNISMPNLKNLLVARPKNQKDELAVREKVVASYSKRKDSESLYNKAEILLLSELHLDDLDTSQTLFYETNFSAIKKMARIDAEHFQPRYYHILNAIKKTKPQNIIPLGNLVSFLSNGHTPLHHDLSVGEIPFLTAEHVFDFRVNYDSEKRILKEHHDDELKRTRLCEGDFLITIKGRIGNAAIVENIPTPTNINQDVAMFRLNGELPPYYLMAFINSLAGKAFIQQYCTGQINPFLGLGNLRLIPIPIYKSNQMEAIAEKTKATLQSARAAQEESQRLLTEAKQMVEDMILHR